MHSCWHNSFSQTRAKHEGKNIFLNWNWRTLTHIVHNRVSPTSYIPEDPIHMLKPLKASWLNKESGVFERILNFSCFILSDAPLKIENLYCGYSNYNVRFLVFALYCFILNVLASLILEGHLDFPTVMSFLVPE